MKVVMKCIADVDPGPSANEVFMQVDFVFIGTEVEVPGRVQTIERVSLASLNFTTVTAAIWSNLIEDAAIAEAARRGFAAPARTDVFFPSYTRGT